mmetsp:Transcript_66380/g.187008  ORF Transcript_66380/g.187008 Transcript_66380/m.187008 type:complete len:530 (+) Transcript_66380:61-1650(+)
MAFCCGTKPRSHQPQPEDGVAKLPGPVDALRKQIGAENLATPEDGSAYQHRRFHGQGHTESWNIHAIGHPSAIATATCVEHVQAIVNYAREHCLPADVPFSVAGGRHGHLYMPNNGLVLDVSGLNSVSIADEDPDAVTCTVGGGCTGLVFHDFLQKRGYVCVAGNHHSTGLAGQFLHGGHGYLERKMGMVVDNVVRVEVVTADGSLRACSREENEDLFWACRGAVSNFGVAVSITVRLMRMTRDNMICVGTSVQVPKGEGRRRAILTNYVGAFGRRAELNADKMGGLVCMAGGPVLHQVVFSGEPLPDAKSWSSSATSLYEGRSAQEVLEKVAKPWWKEFTKDHKLSPKCGVRCSHYFNQLQKDPMSPPPSADYILTFELSEVTEQVIDVFCEALLGKNKPKGLHLGLMMLMTAASTVSLGRGRDDMAYYHSDAAWHGMVHGICQHKGGAGKYEAGRRVAEQWANDVMKRMKATGCVLGGYNIFPNSEEDPSILYGGNMDRLVELKGKYDEGNLFRRGANVKPASTLSC